MSNATQTKQTESKSDATPDAIAAAAKAKAKAIRATVDGEKARQAETLKAYRQASREMGSIGLEERAVECGQSVNATGRPSIDAFNLLAQAIVEYRDAKGNKMGFRQRDRLFAMARDAVGSKKGEESFYSPKSNEELAKAKERFVKAKGKATDDAASCSLRMARPAAEEIALGE